MMLPLFALAVAVSTPPCQYISADRIHARDLAAAAPAFAKLPPDLDVGFAPAPGLTKIFRAAELQRTLRGAGMNGEGLADVCVEWKMRTLSQDDLIAAMQRALEPRHVDIRIVESSRFAAPEGPVIFTDPPLAGATGGETPLLWRGFVQYAPGRKFSVWARVLLRSGGTRVIAAEPLRPGQAIRADQIRIEPWSGPLTRLDELSSADQAVGNTVKFPVGAGGVVRRSMLARPAEVLRGDTVHVRIVSANALISLEGIAEETGVRGATIRVRNAATGKKFRAQVDGRDTVSVNRVPMAVTGG